MIVHDVGSLVDQHRLLAISCTPAGMRPSKVVHIFTSPRVIHRRARFGSRRWRRSAIQIHMNEQHGTKSRVHARVCVSGVASRLNSVQWGNPPGGGGMQGWRANRQVAGDCR